MTVEPGILDVLFREARTWNAWAADRPVDDDKLREIFEVMKWGPTSANTSPARFVFVRTPEAREKLRPALSQGNVDKTMAAPATVIVAYDPVFYDNLTRLLPQAEARGWFANNPELAEETAFRNSSIQGGYFIIAARALGLDCGPMSGFDRAAVDASLLGDWGWKSNFLINLGHGDSAGLYPRNPRLGFNEACRIV